MIKTFIPFLILFFFASAFVMPVQAEEVQIPVDCLCVEKGYEVYGDEQPEQRRSRNSEGELTQECFVTVDIDPLVSEEDLEEGPDGSFADPTPLSSLASPLEVLFEQSRIKEPFVALAEAVFKGHTQQYHQYMDEEVFGKVVAFMSGFDDSDSLEQYLSEQGGQCEDSGSSPNPKPECVAEKALCSYEKYVGVLFEQTGQSIAQDAVGTEDTGQLLAALQNRDQALLNEAQQTQQALDTALAVYSQFFQTYRLHLQLKELIVHLSRVRDMTGFWSQLVGCIPHKFVGVATTKCN